MEKLTSRTALQVFEIITEHGEKAEEGHQLEGVTATSDIDGYTVHLSDGQVTAHIMFHNTIAINSPNTQAERNFLRRLESLQKSYG